MFFLIRCVFWLWVVFSTIFAQPSSEHAAPHASQSAAQVTAVARPIGSTAQAWLERAATSVADRCASAPATCFAMAAQLSRLASSSIPVAAAPRASQIALDSPHPAAVPLPPRRPRSFAGMARPTMEKTARHEYLMDQLRAEF